MNRNFLHYKILSGLKNKNIVFGFDPLILYKEMEIPSHKEFWKRKKKLKIIIDGAIIFTLCVYTSQVDPSISFKKWKGSQLFFYENKNRNLDFLHRLKNI